ncbi:MAG: hypothetical protein CMJ94_07070 [Planctomycetes bacterium]|nr:hypothetical protein [Planctomycetota bacterium]|tara:strand:+ start:590 stop:847 length:258 start_codon:yes stop_codon:yes gene_type:complete
MTKVTEEQHAHWREEYLGMKKLSKFQESMLTNGPKSLSQSWILQAMYQDWKSKKGIKDPEPPNCQSSLKEWSQSVRKYQTRGTTS